MTKKTSTKKPKRKFGTIDCETDPFLFGRIPKPFIWGYYDENGFKHFFDTGDFIDFIKTECQGRTLYAHNGGKFDFHFLLDGLEEQENIMIINGRIARIKIGEVELRDSYLLLPVPLSAYKKDEIDYAIFEEDERRKIDNMASIIEYLKGDCKYLYDILDVQFEMYGNKLTLASSAFDFWHKKFNPYKDKPKTSASFFQTFKPYYYGGRVQCFEKGIVEKEFQVYDINSAYPYAMKFKHPFGDEISYSEKIPEDLGGNFLDIHAISKGALPFRGIDKSLTFPDDQEIRNYKITGWELKSALENNAIEIVKVNSVYEFKNHICFEEYVEHFFKEKAAHKNGDEAKYLLAKLYMTSLYGKFGQSSFDHRDYELTDAGYIEAYINAGYDFEGILGIHALMSQPIPEHKQRFYNVATAASITGFIRAFLFDHIVKCENPIYCDTDSIAAVKFNGEIGKELGQWECEGDFVRAAIGGKKLYAFERKVNKKDSKFKISSKGAKLNEKEIFSIARGEEIEYKNIAPTFSVTKPAVFVERKIRLT